LAYGIQQEGKRVENEEANTLTMEVNVFNINLLCSKGKDKLLIIFKFLYDKEK
jgi:hypothetical protein